MVDHARAQKIAGTIKRVVAAALKSEITDPRLGFVTVTDVRVTGDLQHASVFYTVLGPDHEREGTAAALESAKGRLRSRVGRELGIRLTPSLEFILDAVPETAASLETALAEAQQRDAATAALREGAAFAGDEDPYRRKDEQAPEADRDGDAGGGGGSF